MSDGNFTDRDYQGHVHPAAMAASRCNRALVSIVDGIRDIISRMENWYDEHGQFCRCPWCWRGEGVTGYMMEDTLRSVEYLLGNVVRDIEGQIIASNAPPVEGLPVEALPEAICGTIGERGAL